MSVRWMAEVFELAGISEADGWLLLALADHADDQGGSIFPSVARIAHKTGWSARTVQRALRRLVQRGLLVQVAEAHAQTPREYRLSFAGVARKLAYRPRKTEGEGCQQGVTPDSVVTPDTALSPEGCQKGPFRPPEGCQPLSPYPSVREPSVNRQGDEGRKRRLPPDFVLTPDRVASAREAGCHDPAVMLAHFRDYWRANGERRVDWDAVWRNWGRNGHGPQAGGRACPCARSAPLPPRPGGKMSVLDAARVVAARMAAKGEV